MNITNNCLDIIKKYEGLKLKAYECPASTPKNRFFTIGYGTTLINGRPVPEGLVITKEQAEEYLIEDVKYFTNWLDKNIKSKINQNMFDSLSSLIYNIGITNFKSSTLFKKVNYNPNDKTIKDEFLKWIYVNKKEMEGLKRRRTEEFLLYSL